MRPNSLLPNQRPRVLLVVSPIQEESANKILKGIAQFQRQHGTWETYWDNELRSLSDPKWLSEGGWHGVISRHTNELQVNTCKHLGIPLVDVNDARPFPGIPNIQLNNVAVGHLGGEHFIDRGLSNLGFFGYSNEVWSLERRNGFAEALKMAGHECEILEIAYPGYDTPEWDAAQREEAARWLKQLPKPVGVMACNDFRALLLMQAAQAAGLRIPEDVAILGANDDEVRCELANPPLSSVATNHLQSGYQAAKVLAELLEGRPVLNTYTNVDPDSVVTRHSTDILAVPDRKIAAAANFIKQNACKGICVDQVARHAGMARTQLEQKFRRYFARSPQAEIRRVQLAAIRSLLVSSDLPLRTVAELTGFAHTEYLSVFFKRETGESPGRFRRKLQLAAR